MDNNYILEIKEDSSFVWRVVSQKTGRVLFENTTGFIKIIKNGKGILKGNSLIEFNISSDENKKEFTKKYLVFDGIELIPPPYDADYGDFDYFPFTPVNDFKGHWDRE